MVTPVFPTPKRPQWLRRHPPAVRRSIIPRRIIKHSHNNRNRTPMPACLREARRTNWSMPPPCNRACMLRPPLRLRLRPTPPVRVSKARSSKRDGQQLASTLGNEFPNGTGESRVSTADNADHERSRSNQLGGGDFPATPSTPITQPMPFVPPSNANGGTAPIASYIEPAAQDRSVASASYDTADQSHYERTATNDSPAQAREWRPGSTASVGDTMTTR